MPLELKRFYVVTAPLAFGDPLVAPGANGFDFADRVRHRFPFRPAAVMSRG